MFPQLLSILSFILILAMAEYGGKKREHKNRSIGAVRGWGKRKANSRKADSIRYIPINKGNITIATMEI